MPITTMRELRDWISADLRRHDLPSGIHGWVGLIRLPVSAMADPAPIDGVCRQSQGVGLEDRRRGSEVATSGRRIEAGLQHPDERDWPRTQTSALGDHRGER